MAETKTSKALKKLTPNAAEVVINGIEVRIPLTKEGNAMMNMIMAAQGRSMISRSIQKWIDMEEHPTPKELKDLTGAMRDLAEFSNIIYSGPDIPIPTEKKVEPEEEAPDFSKLGKSIEVTTEEVKNEQGTNPDTERAGSGLPKSDSGQS